MAKKDKAEAAPAEGRGRALKAVTWPSRRKPSRPRSASNCATCWPAQKNLPAHDVPDGEDEAGNVEVAPLGRAPTRGRPPKDHADLGEAMGLLDFEAAAPDERRALRGAEGPGWRGWNGRSASSCWTMQTRARLSGGQSAVSGARRGDVRDGATAFYCLFFSLPLTSTLNMVPSSTEAMFEQPAARSSADHPDFRGLARFGEAEPLDIWRCRFVDLGENEGADVRWLIPTAEVSLTNLVREQILSEERAAAAADRP